MAPDSDRAPSAADSPQRAHASEPRQASLRRLRQFGVRPNRELGQNFLVDDNILRVVGRLAELEAADVVLEVGGGLGVLSEYLAERAGHVHVVEVDPALRPALEDALRRHPNATVHLADALRLDLRTLSPPPTKVVANLPYGVAATVLLKSIEELPEATLWVAMVQREVAERLAAGPGGKVYGVTSVLAQLSCEVRLERRVASSVFHPEPRVESALCVLRRIAPSPAPEVAALVHAAFAHRRKALARSVALAAPADPGIRETLRAALREMDLRADSRAEALSPDEFKELSQRLDDAARAALPAPR